VFNSNTKSLPHIPAGSIHWSYLLPPCQPSYFEQNKQHSAPLLTRGLTKTSAYVPINITSNTKKTSGTSKYCQRVGQTQEEYQSNKEQVQMDTLQETVLVRTGNKF
jgi:hypothetical protein